METYGKINAPFFRHTEGQNKGKLIFDKWARPEFEYLADCEWEFSEKIDGENRRIGYDADKGTVEFGGRTDRAVIRPRGLQYLDETFSPELFSRASMPSLTLFGEHYGPAIQNGGSYRDDDSFILFDVLVGGFWLDRNNVEDIGNKLGLDVVPLIGYGTLQDAIQLVRGGLESRIGRDRNAEGIIAKPVVPLFNRKGERIITKVKDVDFR